MSNFLILVFHLIFGRFLASVIALLSRTILSFICTPVLFGSVVAATTSIALVVRLISSGIGQSGQHFAAKSDDGYYDSSLLFSYVLLLFVSILLCLFFTELYSTAFRDSGENLISIFELLKYSLPFNVIHFVVLLFFVGKNSVRVVNKLTLIPVFSTFVLYSFVWLLRLPEIFVLYSIVFSSLLGFVLSFYYIYVHQMSLRTFNFFKFKEIIKHSISVTPVTTFAYFSSNSVLLVGGYVTGYASVAIFVIANMFVEVLTQIYGPINMFAFNKFIKSKKSLDDLAQASRVMCIFMLVISIITLPIGVVMIKFLFSDEYLKATNLLPYMLFAGVLLSIQKLLESYLYAVEKHRVISIAQFFYILPVFILMPILNEILGDVTLGVIFLLSAFFSFSVILRYVLRLSELTIGYYLIPKVSDFIFIFESLSKIKMFSSAANYILHKFFRRPA